MSGTPTTLGDYVFTVNVSDSSTPVAQVGSTTFFIDIVNPLGRNDTIASATSIGNGSFQASLSPYIDPPGSAPLPADNDYYKVVSLSGSTVQLETFAQRSSLGGPIDTVMEIVDGNNVRLATCQLPGSTSTTFTSSCISDDIGPNTLDSALNFQVPGPRQYADNFLRAYSRLARRCTARHELLPASIRRSWSLGRQYRPQIVLIPRSVSVIGCHQRYRIGARKRGEFVPRQCSSVAYLRKS